MNDTLSQTWINATQFEAVKKLLISGSLQWPFLFPNPSGTHSSVNMAKHLTKFFTLQVAPFNPRARQVLLWKNVLWFYRSKRGHIKWNPLPWHGTQTLGDNSLLRIFSSFLMPTALTSANNLKRFCFLFFVFCVTTKPEMITYFYRWPLLLPTNSLTCAVPIHAYM